jgi:hypothetical protein
MADKEHTLPKRKTGRLIGGWALIVVAVLGGWYNLTTSPTSSGDLLPRHIESSRPIGRQRGHGDSNDRVHRLGRAFDPNSLKVTLWL